MQEYLYPPTSKGLAELEALISANPADFELNVMPIMDRLTKFSAKPSKKLDAICVRA